MEYQYSKLSLPTDQELPVPDEGFTEFKPPSVKAEYEVRKTVLVDGGDRFGVSTVVFDKHEELIWMGNQGGHVTSYYGPTMQKYTSFQIHATEEVRDIITADEGIYALTTSTLRHQIRRGIPKHTFKSDNMSDMQCLYHVSSTKLLMGGHQNKLLELDLRKMKETVIPIEEEGCAVLRSGGGSLVTCGSVGGVVTLRDVRTPNVAQHSFRAHSACLSDLDMQGDLLISCGFSHSTNGVAVADSSVIVWDVRCLRSAKKGVWSANLAWPPLLLHFLPTVSGRAVAVAGDGNVALLHVNEPSTKEYSSIFQVDTQNTVCNVMDVSSTSQALVFGDQSGHLNLFSAQHNTEPVYNNFSRDTEFADPLPTLPSAGLNNDKFKFSSIPRAPLAAGEKWFHELPEEFFRVVYRRPKPIDPEILKTMKMQGPIGYAPNPKTCRRNEMPYIIDSLEDLKTAEQDDSINSLPIPKYYLKVDSRFNKNDKEAEIGNKTGLSALQSTLPNSYCNSMLQVLYHTISVKETLLAHACTKEFCLSCELAYLFRTLEKSNGKSCEAGNFLRAFRTVPEAAALGLILPDNGIPYRVDLIALIQSWNRFILHQMHYEILETKKKVKELVYLAQTATTSPPKSTSRLGNPSISNAKVNSRVPNGHVGEEYTELEYIGPTNDHENHNGDLNGFSEEAWRSNIGPEEGTVPSCNTLELSSPNDDTQESDISQLFAIGRSHLNKCLKCNKEEERSTVVLACALQYPLPSRSPARAGFVSLLRASLAARRSTPAWCDRCRRFSPTLQRARLLRLPPVLSINCGGVTPHEKAYWTKEYHKDTAEGTKRPNSNKPCRYGLHCSRPGCRFKHPDRPGTSHNSVVEPPSHCILPLHMVISLHKDGDVSILDKLNPKLDTHNGDSRDVRTELEYDLSAAIMCVEDGAKNLVAFINTRPGPEPAWHLFNDTNIVPVETDEVIEFSAWWKSPCVLFYTNTTTNTTHAGSRAYAENHRHP